MNDNKNEDIKAIRFYSPRGMEYAVVAARPNTGAAIAFNRIAKKWNVSRNSYYQMVLSGDYKRISDEQAKSIYQDVPPDTSLLDEIDMLRGIGGNAEAE